VKNCGRCKAADTTTCTAEPPEETTTGTGIRPVVVVVEVIVVVAAAAVVVEIVNNTLLSATCSDQPNRPVLDLFSPAGYKAKLTYESGFVLSCRDSLRVQRQSAIQVLTGPGVKQLCRLRPTC